MDLMLDVAKMAIAAVITYVATTIKERRSNKVQRSREREQRIANEAKMPKLAIVFDPRNNECVTPWTYRAPTQLTSYTQTTHATDFTDSYVSVLVANAGEATVRNCTGYLAAVERRDGDSWVQLSIGGRLPLAWAMDETDIALARHTSKGLNLLHAEGSSNTLTVRVEGGMPALLKPSFTTAGEFRFTVVVDADGADARDIRVGVRWNPETAGTWGEGDLWLDNDNASPS